MEAPMVDIMGNIMMDIVAIDIEMIETMAIEIVVIEIVMIETMGNMKVETMTMDIGDRLA
jgi:hypothetical protein